MPFPPVAPRLDLVALEAEIGDLWRREDLFARSLAQRAGAPPWVFYEGPPTANGRPGIHHVWARVFKDLFPRFHTMRGRYVARKGGWDCHGLPVEVEVEKELGFSGKVEIERYGIAEFNRRCRESVLRFVDEFERLTERIGMWLDTEHAYKTMDNTYIETVWWLFRRMWDDGLIYEGHKVVPYCGRCGTALSSHELGQPGAYRDLTEDSVYVRFPLAGADVDLLVWTTTPWTLVSNVGVAVGPHIDYVRVRSPEAGRRDLVMARTRVVEVLGENAEIVAPVPVADLVGRTYDRPFTVLPEPDGASRVVAADFVTVDDGSGVVHLAPAFGEIDREVAQAHGLPTLNPVGPDAAFDESVPELAGTFVKDADPALIDALRTSGRLEKVEPYTHSYPHCWRCGTPLVYWAKPTWFARTSACKERMTTENECVGWHPEHIKHGRFGDWLRNNVDWALSRDRYWGTPIPVWRCDACGHDTCVESVAELATLVGSDLAALDLHRPYVDDVPFPCPSCGSGTAQRVESVLDAWFDSGSMPAAQFHYPFENEDVFTDAFPADFICEAIDQTRGWFYTLLAVNTMVFDRAPYRNVVCLALVVDKDGQKMSKSRGNVIDPWTVLDTRGADALRWNMLSSGSPWTARRVFLESIDESTNRFLVTLWNTYVFAVTYANLDAWEPTVVPTEALSVGAHVMDRWIRSRLHSTVQAVTDALEDYDALRAAQALDGLVDDLSNWYVRRSRARFWRSSDPRAHAVLHECLTTVSRLLAPFCPFVSDALHRALVPDHGSVHLADWPDVDKDAVDPELEAEMHSARALASLGLSARNEAALKVRQPLRQGLYLLPAGPGLSADVAAEVADELNVKDLTRVDTLTGLLDEHAVPDFRRLGPKVGPLTPRVKEALARTDGARVRASLESTGRFELDLGDTVVVLEPDDVDIRATAHGELTLAQGAGRAVALDTALDPELRREGLARGAVRVLNDHRKELGLDIADRIDVVITASGELAEALAEHAEWIAGEILARRVTLNSEADTLAARRLVDDHPLDVRVVKVEA